MNSFDLSSRISDSCGIGPGHHFYEADPEQQCPEYPFLADNQVLSDD
jgi:hypothetical protein